jgi:hypothetical protein
MKENLFTVVTTVVVGPIYPVPALEGPERKYPGAANVCPSGAELTTWPCLCIRLPLACEEKRSCAEPGRHKRIV